MEWANKFQEEAEEFQKIKLEEKLQEKMKKKLYKEMLDEQLSPIKFN
mgnify:CR=1 FL=1